MQPTILAEQIHVGDRVTFGREVVVGGPHGTPARSVSIGAGAVLQQRFEVRCDDGALRVGDRAFLGNDGRALCGSLFVGDYTRLHNHIFIHGPGHIHVGHNCWVGGSCVLDGVGGILVGDNVGVGAHSQLWSHLQFGDILAGCRWHSKSPLVVEEDVWFVGHCIVSPIRAHRRSMALVGSVVTHDMAANHVYAGVPAKDVTDRLGPQFEDPPFEARLQRMRGYLDEFYAAHPRYRDRTLVPVAEYGDAEPAGLTQLHLMERTYTKRGTPEEQDFLAFVTPTLAKFVPRGWTCPSRSA